MNDKKPSIKKNFIYSTVYQVFNVLIPIVTAPYVARVLGADGNGIYSFTTSIQSYFLLFAALGTMAYGTREISMNRDDPYKRSKLFWEIELITVFTSLAAVFIWVFLIIFSKEYKLYFLILTIGIFATLFDITWFFNGIEEFKITVIRNVLFKLIGIICLFTFIKSKDDLALYILITSLTTLFSSMSLWPYMKRYLVKVNPKEFKFRVHFRETWIYFVPTIATSVYTVLDRTLIGLITHDNSENGYYQQAEKIINIAKSVVFTAINSVVGTRISYLYAEEKYDEIKKRINNSFHYIFFMGFGCCFGIMGIAKNFVPLFFGPGYEKVEPLLYIFSPIVVIIGISNCLGSQYYTPCGKRSQSAKFIIIGSAINLVLNLCLIPTMGAYGAAIASIIAEVTITGLYVHYSGDYGKLSQLIKLCYKKLVSGMIMFAVVYAINYVKLNSIIILLLQMMIGFSVYTASLLLLKDSWTVMTIESIMRKVLNRIRK